jgi:hypothetical protein
MGGKESGGPITIGYHYFLSMQLAICKGPVDYVKDIRSYENVIIHGKNDIEQTSLRPSLRSDGSYNTDDLLSVNVEHPNIYGGVKREGGVGVSGTANGSTVYLANGGYSQPRMTRLAELVAGTGESRNAITSFGASPSAYVPITSFTLKDLAQHLRSTVMATPSNVDVATTLVAEDIQILVETKVVTDPVTSAPVSTTEEKKVVVATTTTTTQTSVVPVTQNALVNEVGYADRLSAYRGIAYCVWDDLHYQTNSSRPKPWNFKVCRVPFRLAKTKAGKAIGVINNDTKDNVNSIALMGGADMGSVSKKGGVGDPSFKINDMLVTFPWKKTAYYTSNGPAGKPYALDQFYWNAKVIWTGRKITADSGVKTVVPPSVVSWAYYELTTGLNESGTSSQVWVKLEWTQAFCAAISSSYYASAEVMFSQADKLAEIASQSVASNDGRKASHEEANPALIILECLVSPEYGMSYPLEFIDFDSFEFAAETLATEEFGMSAVWENNATVEDFISTVIQTINAVLYVHPLTSKFTLQLIRKWTGNKKLANEYNVLEMRSFARPAISELTNQVTLQWTDAILGTQRSMTVHNTAMREMQGGIIGTIRNYVGITSDKLANQLAARDLAILSQPLATVELIVNRDFMDSHLGEVIEFHWLDLGIESMILRIVDIGYGLIEDGRITLKCVEDVYNVGIASFIPMSEPEMAAVKTDTAHIPVEYDLVNLNYVDLLRLRLQAGATTSFDYVDTSGGAIAAFCGAKTENEKIFELAVRSTIGTGIIEVDNTPSDYTHPENSKLYRTIGVYDTVPYAETSVLAHRHETVIHLNVEVSLLLQTVKGQDVYAYCNGEYLQIIEFGVNYETVTVGRGCISSVPQEIPVGSTIWFYSQDLDKVTIDIEWVAKQQIGGTMFPVSNNNRLKDENAPPTKVVTVNSNWANPYPPASIGVESDDSGYMRIHWKHRDAVAQQDKLLSESDAGMPRRPGIYYAIRVLTTDGNLTPNPMNIPRYVGAKNVTGGFDTEYVTYDMVDNWWALPVVVVAVKAVEGELHSDWAYVEYNTVTNTVTNKSYPQSFFGTFTPVTMDLMTKLRVEVSGDFDYDPDQSRYEFEGEELKLSFKTNINTILEDEKMFHSQEELDSWFKRYRIDFYNLETVVPKLNSSGVVIPGEFTSPILVTKYTKEDYFNYVLHDNASDHKNAAQVHDNLPSPTFGFMVYVEDIHGNLSLAHSTVKTKAGETFNTPDSFTTVTSSTGLKVPSNAPRQGLVAILGTTATLTRDATISKDVNYYYVRKGTVTAVDVTPVYKFNVLGATVIDSVLDMTGLDVIHPKTLDITRLEMDTITNLTKEVQVTK